MNNIRQNTTPVDAEQLFNEMLNEVEGLLTVCGYAYEAADILKAVDPIAYRCAVSDYMDSLLSDGSIVEVDGEYYASSDIEGA